MYLKIQSIDLYKTLHVTVSVYWNVLNTASHLLQEKQQLQRSLELSEQDVERCCNQVASSDLLVQQLTAKVKELKESDCEPKVRVERDALQIE